MRFRGIVRPARPHHAIRRRPSPEPVSTRVDFPQAVRLAVAQPGDVGDPPVILQLDEIEPDGRRLAEIREPDGGGGFGRRALAPLDRDVESGNLPILRVDERIEVERPTSLRCAAAFWSLTIKVASDGSKKRRIERSLSSAGRWRPCPCRRHRWRSRRQAPTHPPRRRRRKREDAETGGDGDEERSSASCRHEDRQRCRAVVIIGDAANFRKMQRGGRPAKGLLCCRPRACDTAPRSVAQLARAPVSKTGGWGFESLHSCQIRD